MDTLLYVVARALMGFIQLLPLTIVARLGRMGGQIVYWLDGRHRRVALQNLSRCFGAEKSPSEIKVLVRENFRRIGENFGCAVKTAAMAPWEVARVLEVVGAEKLRVPASGKPDRNFVIAIGHFGNFELYARAGHGVPGFQFATTYRGLREPSLNRVLQSLRERSGCRFFERRTDAAALKAAMSGTGTMLGLLADQHAGDRGLRLPFFGVDCSTSAAPAVFALRYHSQLHTAICHRLGLARWRIEIGDEIPTVVNDHPRPVSEIMRDVNLAFETAVRRDPANWFWVHNRWKPGKYRQAAVVEPAHDHAEMEDH